VSFDGSSIVAISHTIPKNIQADPRVQRHDPRIGLKAGLHDAGEAAFGMERIASLLRPEAFQLVPYASDLPGNDTTVRTREWGANTDMAFQGSLLFIGNYDGVNVYDITEPAKLRLVQSIVCPGGQGDVSIYGPLLFMSVEAMDGRLDCGTQGFPAEPVDSHKLLSDAKSGTTFDLPPSLSSPDRMRGLRIFDIGDLSRPRQVANVQTCRGSHTHTIVPNPKDRRNIYVYSSGIASVRAHSESLSCTAAVSRDGGDTVVFDVIRVPLAHPEQARVIARPTVSARLGAGRGETRQNPSKGAATFGMGCHDITVLAPGGLAAASCIGRGLLLDVSNPVHPVRTAVVADSHFSFWHSATFSNDGRKVLFTDEWGAGQMPHCRVSDPVNWGADAIFTLKRRKPMLASYYKLPAPQTEMENCTAHNGSLIPIPGRDVEVQAWYQGGISIVDFTDAGHPVEIGYFDRGPLNELHPVVGGDWSAYYYNGYIYGSEMTRGVDVFQLVPNEYLTHANARPIEGTRAADFCSAALCRRSHDCGRSGQNTCAFSHPAPTSSTMNLYLRLLLSLLRAPFRPRIERDAPARTVFHCLPTDLDIYGHMNNARYFAILDLARLDYMFQSRTFGIFLKHRWYAVVAAETIRFHASLKLMERFEVETSPLGHDERTLFVQQRVFRKGMLIADATIRVSVQSASSGTVSPREVLQAMGKEVTPPVLTAWLVAWSTIPTVNNGYATPVRADRASPASPACQCGVTAVGARREPAAPLE